MIAQEESSPRRGGTIDGHANAPEAGAAGIDELFARTRTEVSNLLDSLKRILFVEWQGLRLRAIDVFFRGTFFLCIVGFGFAASVSAALMLVRGAKSALQAWSGAEWVGDLGGGALILSVLVLGGLVMRAVLRRELVRETEAGLALVPRPASEVRP